MKKTLRLVAGILLVSAIAFIPGSFDSTPSLIDNSALAFFEQDPGGDGGPGGSCEYCSQSACGCASPPTGCTLSYSCACSSISCSRDCNYNCRQP